MSWVCRFDARALRDLKKLGPDDRKKIVSYLEERIEGNADPRRFGKPLKAELAGLWRYRVGDFRIICRIIDHELVVLVVSAGHRKDIYR